MSIIASLEMMNIQLAARIEIMLAMVSLSISQLLLKTLTQFSISELMALRGIFVVIGTSLLLEYGSGKKINQMYPIMKDKQLLVIIQAFLMAFQCFMFFYAIRVLSLAEALIIYNTYNIWTQFSTQLLVKEQIQFSRIVVVIFSLIGLIFVIQPAVIFGTSSGTPLNSSRIFGIGICLLASIIYGISISLIKLFGTNQGPFVGLQYFHFFCMVLACIMMIQYERVDNFEMNLENLMGIIAFSLMSSLAQGLMFRSYSLVNAAILSPYTFTNVLMSVLLDFLVLSNVPNNFTLFGCGILIGSVGVSLIEDRKCIKK